MIDGLLPAAALLQAVDYVTVGVVRATPTDLVRLVVLPVYGWAAYRDVRTRRVPNETWVPLAILGVILLAVDARAALAAGGATADAFALRAGLGVGFVVPLAYLFWRIGGFGGADAKALMVLAVLLPTFPAYLFLPPLSGPIGSLPLEPTPVGIFSFTVLTNGVIVGAAYPVGVTLRNALAGRFAPVMFVGRPVEVEAVPDTYGRLLETPEGTTRGGLDLDALRMYLQWRGASLSELRSEPDSFRDPATLPEEPNRPGDGAITDGGHPDGDDPSTDDDRGDEPPRPAGNGPDGPTRQEEQGAAGDGPAREDREGSDGATVGREQSGAGGEIGAGVGGEGDRSPGPDDDVGPDDGRPADPGRDGSEALDGARYDDPWGAETFLADVGGAYGTTPEQLREGLEVLVERDDVWVSPGLPFLVPLFLGLVLAFVYGDVLFGLLRALGAV